MQSSLPGGLYIDRDAISHHSCSDVTTLHELHAFKLVIPLDAPLLLEDASGERGLVERPVLVTPHVTQLMGCEGHTIAFFWEAESRTGLELGAQWSPGIHTLDGRSASTLHALAGLAREHIRDPGAVET